MTGARKGGKAGRYAENVRLAEAGRRIAGQHPLVRRIAGFETRWEGEALAQPAGAWVAVRTEPFFSRARGLYSQRPKAIVFPNVRRRADPEEWAYVFGRIALHYVLCHMDPERDDLAWHVACWARAEELASVAGAGRRPADLGGLPEGLPRGDEAGLADHVEAQGPGELCWLSLGAPGRPFWTATREAPLTDDIREERAAALAAGIRAAATQAVAVAGGIAAATDDPQRLATPARAARAFVVSHLPLLAALASSFTLVEDRETCLRTGVSVAAISDETQEIFVNPDADLDDDEAVFVMAHEFLHAGLRHTARRQGRDPWLWNVACDYVINDWLIEMAVGTPPERIGYLHDPALAGLSAEEVYDRIVGDLRWMRRLRKARTLNGGAPDMIEGGRPPGWWRGGGMDLDAFYRRALSEGLELQVRSGRGLLPAGLVEEIRALQQPPIPWDVALAQWLDSFFPPLEQRRSYARAHRRQSATPDIPRPARVSPDEARRTRVFGAVVDTSGSMSRADIGRAMGAIASYGMSRDVGLVRLVECDAAARDAGWVAPEALMERVRVTGRGGTVLTPGVRLLESAADFPPDGPILVVTDAGCDRLAIRREHAFLIAGPGRLPFPPRGPVFRMA